MSAPQPRQAGGLRVRLWRAVRIRAARGAVTAADLARIAVRDDEDPDRVLAAARIYLSALARAGVLHRLVRRARSGGGRAGGEFRYRLLHDLGPLAPLVAGGGAVLRDPNSGREMPIAPRPGPRPPAGGGEGRP